MESIPSTDGNAQVQGVTYILYRDGEPLRRAVFHHGMYLTHDKRYVRPSSDLYVKVPHPYEPQAVAALVQFFALAARRLKPITREDRIRRAALQGLMGVAALGGMQHTPSPVRHTGSIARCVHGFGLAGGFSSCSKCGIKLKELR